MHRAQLAYARDATPDADLLIRQHAALIDGVIRRVVYRLGRPELAEELWSAAALGLVDAARRFEPGRGIRFTTFAEHRVRGAVMDELRRQDPLPRRLRDELARIAQAREALAAKLGHDPDDEDLAAQLGITLDALAGLRGLSRPPGELEEARSVPFDAPDAEELLARHGERARVAAALGTLPERLQLVLSLHFVEELTYREIAAVLKVSEPRVCQLQKEALAALRRALADADDGREP